jgi:C-methyltransferase C-terminal domain
MSKKIDKYLPGTAIPVLDERKLYEDQPEYALLLSWHIAEELRDNLTRKGFRGGFVVPLPEPRVQLAEAVGA